MRRSVVLLVLVAACGSSPSSSPQPPPPVEEPGTAPADAWSAITRAGLGRGEVQMRELPGLGLWAPVPLDAELENHSDQIGFPVAVIYPPETAQDALGHLAVYTTGPDSDLRVSLADTKAFVQDKFRGADEDFLGFTAESTTDDGWILEYRSRDNEAAQDRYYVTVRRQLGDQLWDCLFKTADPDALPGGRQVCASLRPTP